MSDWLRERTGSGGTRDDEDTTVVLVIVTALSRTTPAPAPMARTGWAYWTNHPRGMPAPGDNAWWSSGLGH